MPLLNTSQSIPSPSQMARIRPPLVAQFLSQARLSRWASSELVCSDSLSAHAAECPTSSFFVEDINHLAHSEKGCMGWFFALKPPECQPLVAVDNSWSRLNRQHPITPSTSRQQLEEKQSSCLLNHRRALQRRA